ncbi:MAG: RNA polymerase sigma factor [Patescibacteria group bacterium]|jgi:RNA polymerase sigma-70 factor (ECF subfamily)
MDSSLAALTDEDLAIKALKNDKLALGELFKRYHKRFFNLAYRFSGDYYAADDLTSEIFLRIYRYLRSFDRAKASFKTWGYKIAANVCLTFQSQKVKVKIQKLNTKLKNEDGEETETLEDMIPDPKVDLLKEVEINEIGQRIQKALGELPKKPRLSLYFFYFEDLKYEEIAVTLELPINTVRTHIRRGKEKLKIELKDLIDGR